MEQDIPALVVTGPVGAGKSTVIAAISRVLDQKRVPHVTIDMDDLRQVYPAPEDDPFAARVGIRNLAAIWPNMRIVDPRYVLIADVVEHRSQIEDYATAMPGTDVIVVRLHVPMPLLLARLEGRESEHTIGWYRQRAPELQAIMEREQVADIVIDVGHRTPDDVAEEILRRVGRG